MRNKNYVVPHIWMNPLLHTLSKNNLMDSNFCYFYIFESTHLLLVVFCYKAIKYFFLCTTI